MQMPCVTLLASNVFTEKRMAYMALCLLLDQKSEVLLLATQTIKKDLDSYNTNVQALALNAIGEVCTADMCRELVGEVVKLMQGTSSYIKKKAACAATKVLKKCPELAELFHQYLSLYFEDKNHGVLLSGLSLAIQMFKNDRKCAFNYKQYVPSLVKYLRNLISVNYLPEFDVNGITDPFLQCKILEAMMYFGKGSSEVSDELVDILANVSNSTETGKNTGNAILYELVKTINGIEPNAGLKALSSTIIGKFLSSRDNNFKYIALNILQEVVKVDVHLVQKHKNTILECLKDTDSSIQRRALDLVYLIVNTSNIKHIIKECLNFLLVADQEIKMELTTKIWQSLDKFAPNLKWQIDTAVKMLCLSGTFVSEDTISSIINLIIASEELNHYSVHKLFLALKNNNTQEALVKVAIYVIGEYGDLLVNNPAIGPENEQITYSEEEVLNLLREINGKKYSNSSVKEYLMNCLIKLSSKFVQSSSKDQIRNLVESEAKSYFCEVQQRAIEYLQFGRIINENLQKEITDHIPNAKKEENFIKKYNILINIGNL
jgi:AP-1 complex subunit gamma-1